MGEIDELTQKILKFRDKRDWKQFHKPKDVAISLALEAAEVLEHFQWKSEVEIDKYTPSNRDAIGEELADVLYWVLLMANDLDINITDALVKKIEKNESKYPVTKAKGNHLKYSEFSS